MLNLALGAPKGSLAPAGVSVLTSNLEKIEFLLVQHLNLFYIHTKAPCKT